MAQELAVRGGAGVDEHPAPRRNGVLVRRGAFAVRREVFAVATMSAPARRLLRERLDSELDAVRGAIRKAEFLSRGADAAAAAPPAGKDGRLSAAGAAVAAEGGGRAAKKRKVPPFAGQGAGEAKRARTGDRERLAGRLAALAAALPDHAVAFLQNRRVGGADSRGDGGGGAEKYARPMKGGGALFQLKMLLDKFAPASTPKSHGRRAPLEITPGSHGRALPLVASGGVSCLPRHQGAGGGKKMATVQEEEVEGVDICGCVSRIAIRDIAEEYGELVEGVGVRLLSPLQRKYVDIAEQDDEYVDICGDASPVVFPAAKGKAAGDGSTSPSFSSSYGDSDASSSDSDSSSSSDSDSDSDPGKSFSSRPPPATVPKEKDTNAQPPEPAPEAMHTEKIAEPAVQDQCAPPVPAAFRITSSPPAPAFLRPKVDGNNAPPPEPAPETMQIAEQEELQGQCAPPAPTAHPVTGSPPAGPAPPPKESDTNTQPPEPPAPEAVQCVVPAAAAHPITGVAPPVPAVLLPEENGASSQQPPASPPVAPQVAEPEELQQVQDAVAAPAPIAANDVSDLVTAAKEEAERRRQLAKERAKAKARRALLEVERAALPDERVHPRDMELLGIAAFEHVASTVQQQGVRAAAAPLQVNGGGCLRVSPGNPSVLQQLGVFLKADGGSDDEEDEEQQHQQVAAAALASYGADEEVEDGEIR